MFRGIAQMDLVPKFMETTLSNVPVYLAVPYGEKDRAKGAGARWDPTRRSWFVPAGKPLEYFKEWIPIPVAKGEDPFAWIRLLKGADLSAPPELLLLGQECWKCQVPGYSPMVVIPVPDGDNASNGIQDEIVFASASGWAWGEVTGGKVGDPLVLRQLVAFQAGNPELQGRIATFKDRYSITLGRPYVSQGCPHCDALWGDFALQELASKFGERLITGAFAADFVRAFALSIA